MAWQRVSITADTVGTVAPQQLQRCAVAIANFEPPQGPDSDKYLRLLIGDWVIVEKKCADWYFGRLLDDVNKCGVFPRNYLKFKDGYLHYPQFECDDGSSASTVIHQRCNSIESTSGTITYDSPMVQEISVVLRAWIKCCKAAYVARRIDDVLPVVSMMQDVTKWRKQILSGEYAVDQVKKLKQTIGRKIDVGNKKLGLDLVVRDKLFETVTPDKCSVMELYNHHVAANERIEQDSRTNVQIAPRAVIHTPSSGQLTFPRSSLGVGGVAQLNQASVIRSLYVNILDFYCCVNGDAELSLALYDAKEQQFISESFTMVWPQFAESADDGARRTSLGPGGHGQKVLFTDLGNKDMMRERLYLICRVVRTGSFMESSKEHTSTSHDSGSIGGSNNSVAIVGRRTHVRQSYAVGAMDLREALQVVAVTSMNKNLTPGKHGYEADQERQWFFRFIQCFDDNMEQYLKRVIDTRFQNPTGATPTTPNRSGHLALAENGGNNPYSSSSNLANKDQGIWVGLQLMIGNQEEVKTTYAHVFTPPPAVVRKMGFPEVMSSGDVRNDLYITLAGGDFSHCSRSDKNIEVKVCMVDDRGAVVKDAVSIVGPIAQFVPYYTSTVKYHDDKPKWGETFKMVIPVDEVEKDSKTHVKFTFKHRSSNDSKDKAERPFALAFMRLIESNETIIGNGSHDLVVYKLDKKYEEQNDVSYRSLPSTRLALDRWMTSSGASKNGPGMVGLNCSVKDWFQVRTVVCSTSLTQNVDLRGLLDWHSRRAEIKTSLESLMRSEVERTGEEIVKFLHNVLDALFDILTEFNEYDQQVFDCLVYVIGLVSEHRYSSFKPILDEYLKSHFCAALAYQKLITSFKDYMDKVEESYDRLLSSLKSMEYLMKFIVRSMQRRKDLKGPIDDFPRLMSQLLKAITDLMRLRTDHSIVCQGAGLRYLPFCVSDLAQAYDGKDLAFFIVSTLKNVPSDRLQKEKLWCIQNLIKSDLYKRSEYRRILQHEFLRIICVGHIENDNELDICVNILADLMVVLYGADSGCHPQQIDLRDIVKFALRPIVQVIIRLIERQYSRGDIIPPLLLSRLCNYVALLLSILSELDAELYNDYVNKFVTRTDLIDFVTELLMLFNDMIEKTIFPADWLQMICKRNNVILKILRFITCTIKKHFLHTDFETSVWTVCFRTLVAFVTQKTLQLEQFPTEKRNDVLCRYGDMREICAQELVSLWYSMNFVEKRPLISTMVGPFLEVTLLSQQRVRSLTIPIFFDMMTVGLYQMPGTANGHAGNFGSDSETLFSTFEKELITQLDASIEQGRGDRSYIESFTRIMEARRSTHASQLNKMGERLTGTVKQLLTKLLEFREVRERHDCLDNRMSCTLKLLEFYGCINHTALYIQYVHKLYELHIDCDNYAEAAFTLKLHADKLQWSDDTLRPGLVPEPASYGACTTERTLKEKLYYEILALFDKGKMWERAVQICLELQKEYEENTFDYIKSGILMEKLAKLYRNIMGQTADSCRVAPEYFRVAFYGTGFPSFLQNQVFVYRGHNGERLPEFSARMKSIFPNAHELSVLTPPTPEQLQANNQILQINKVDPFCDDKLLASRFKGRKVDSRISWYYKVNDIQIFVYTRKIQPPKTNDADRKSGLEQNEFSNMWLERTVIVISDPFPGVMRWFPVVSVSQSNVSPLEVAVDTMQEAIKQLLTVMDAVEHSNGGELKPLEAKLQGMLQPAVQGGISNYEKTFFTEEYRGQCGPKELMYIAQLKELISAQIPQLEKGLWLHARYCPDEQLQFHQYLLEAFNQYKRTVEEKYGRKASLLPANASLVPLRQTQHQRTLTKHMSVDSVGASSAVGGDLTFKRQGTKDWPTSHTAWGLRHGISTIGSSGTVPRRNPTTSTTFKRKPSQPLDNNARERTRDSNTSQGSTLSVELLGTDSSPLTAIGSSTSIGNASVINGILTLTEHVTPQRPPRPPSGTSANGISSGMKNDTRSESVHSLLAESHETTPAPTDTSPSGMRSYDRVSTPLRFHHSFDSLHEGDTSPEPPPPLPPRRPSGIVARQPPPLREEDETGATATTPETTGSRAHSFVIPRRPKPLPPRPVAHEHNTTL